MPPEPSAAPVEEQEPIEATPEPTDEAPAEETPQAEQPAEVDWKARHEEAQRAISRQGAELAMYRRGETPEPEPEAEEEAETASAQPPPEGVPPQYIEESWALAERLYGPAAVAAYDSVYRLYAQAVSPADHMAYLNAYHEQVAAAERGETPKAETATAPAGKSRAEAVQPRVDPNRTDAGPDPSLDKKIEEAKGKGDLTSWVHGVVEKLGMG